MKINIIILAGTALQLISAVLLFVDAVAYTLYLSNLGFNIQVQVAIPFMRWWISFYNFGWALAFFLIVWSGKTKVYRDWIMLNMTYQFILNTGEVSGLPTKGIYALYDAALYISISTQVLLICHYYLPDEAVFKKMFLSKLEKIEFNVLSTADFRDPNAAKAQKGSDDVYVDTVQKDDGGNDDDWKPPEKPFGEIKKGPPHPKRESAKSRGEPTLDPTQTIIGNTHQSVGAETEFHGPKSEYQDDISEININIDLEQKDQVCEIIKAKGDDGILLSELKRISTSSMLPDIIKFLEFEERVIYSEPMDGDTKFIYL